MTGSESRISTLKHLWGAAIDAVSGRQAVANALNDDSTFRPDQIIAVGKAASGMCLGALDNLPACDALVVTKYGHADDELKDRERVTILEAAHPIPDQKSLVAGHILLERTFTMQPDSRLLLLVSGGASALAEALPASVNRIGNSRPTSQSLPVTRSRVRLSISPRTML